MSANDILMGTSVPAAKFVNPGDSIRGQVLKVESAQQRDFDTGELAFWKKSGQPMMQAIIDIQTDLRDPAIEGDDGIRRIYVKDHGAPYVKGSGRIRDAFRDAVISAGAKGIEIGGFIDECTYTGPGQGKGAIPPKMFRVRYRPPQQGAPSDQVFAGQQPQQGYQTTVVPGAYSQQQQPAASFHGGYQPQQTPANSILNAMGGQQRPGAGQTEPPF